MLAKYEKYKHTQNLLNILNKSFEGEVFKLEDVESVTGNLLFEMRKLQAIVSRRIYKFEEANNTDLTVLKKQILFEINEFWGDLEMQQTIGLNNLIIVIYKYLVNSRYINSDKDKFLKNG